MLWEDKRAIDSELYTRRDFGYLPLDVIQLRRRLGVPLKEEDARRLVSDLSEEGGWGFLWSRVFCEPHQASHRGLPMDPEKGFEIYCLHITGGKIEIPEELERTVLSRAYSFLGKRGYVMERQEIPKLNIPKISRQRYTDVQERDREEIDEL